VNNGKLNWIANFIWGIADDVLRDLKARASLKGKAFLRTCGFLSSILSYTNAEREKLSIFLTLLVPKLPAPVEENLSKGIRPVSRTSFFDWFAHDTRQLDRERFD